LLSEAISWLSLIHLGDALHFRLLLLVLTLNKKVVSLSGFRDEVLVLGKQEFEIDSWLIKKHTGNGWGKFFTEGLHDRHVDIVTNKVVSFITLELIKFLNVDLRKLQGVLLGWLLLLWRLLTLVHHHWLLLWRHHWSLTWGHLRRWVHTITHHSHGLLLLTTISLLLWATWLSVILVPVLTSTTVSLSASSASTLESSSTSLAAASHVHLAVVHLTTLVLVIVWLLSSHLHATLSIRLTLFALTLHEIDELGNIISLLFISCLLQIILSLPEIDFKRFLVVAETSWLIEELDAFLCTFDILVKDVSDLIACEFLTIVIDFVVFELDREDVSCLAEFFFNFLLSDTFWNEFNVDVGFEHFFLVLNNWVQRAIFWL
jgi:hypothetical protein